jgi:L-amino acid N-acyltransferase YncA
MESELLAAINLDNNQAIALAKEFGWLEEGKNGLKNHRERVEFEAKLIDWNIEIPWGK